MTSQQIAIAAVFALFATNFILIFALIVLKIVHRRRVANHTRRHGEYLGLLSRHLSYEHHTDPITEEMAHDEAFLDAVIDLRNTVAGPEVDKLALIANRFDLVSRQTARLRSRFPLSRRLRAAVSLAEMGDESSAQVLIEHLQDVEDEIRIQSARGLGRMGYSPAIDHILDRLEQESSWVLARFADTLVGFGKKASWPLMAYVKVNQSGGVTASVVEAIRVLGTIGDRDIGPQLARVADLTENAEVKIAAVDALGAIGGPLALPSLLDAFYSNDWRVRAKAATALGEVGDPSVLSELSEGLTDGVWWVRRNSAAALTLVPGGLPALYRALTLEDLFARDAAAEALEDAGELAQARANHSQGVATRDELRLLRHMRGGMVPE